MRKITSILTLVLAFAFTKNAFAQNLENIDKSKTNYIVLTKKVPQLKPIYLASEEMKIDDGADYGEFQIVFCGKDIPQLTDKELMKPYLELLNKGGVKLIACGFSLKKFGVNPKDLAEGIEIVDNGIAYSLKLKKRGFLSMDL